MVVEARDAANCLTMCRKALVIRITQAQISTAARQRSPDPPPSYYPGQQTTVPDFPVRLPITQLFLWRWLLRHIDGFLPLYLVMGDGTEDLTIESSSFSLEGLYL